MSLVPQSRQEQHARFKMARARIDAPRTIQLKPQGRPFGVSAQAFYALLGQEPPPVLGRAFCIGPDANDHVRAFLLAKLDVSDARPPEPSVAFIIAATAAVTGKTILDIKSARRTLDVMLPRQIAMYLCRTMTSRSMPDIGRRFGDRDHTTILHGYRKILRMKDDPEIASIIAAVTARIEASSLAQAPCDLAGAE